MKRFFLILSAVLAVLALVVIAVNLQNEVPYWLFKIKNGSPVSLLAFIFFTGFLTGLFFALAFTAKKVDTGADDF